MIRIHEDLAIPYSGNPWRIFILKAEGATACDLLESAIIREVDLNGTEFRSYTIREAGEDVRNAALEVMDSRRSDHLRQVERLRRLEMGA